MKLISLNIWGGELYQELLDFFQNQRTVVDVFCLQEVTSSKKHREVEDRKRLAIPRFTDMYEQIAELLPEHQGHFGRELQHMAGGDFDYGGAVFVKKACGQYQYSESFPYGAEEDRLYNNQPYEYFSRILQSVCFQDLGVVIHNYHGIWTGGGKGDCPARLEQSARINKVMNSIAVPQILCGDLNLWPDTESLALLTRGRTDLIAQSGITSTRSHYYTKENKYADYTIITDGIKVVQFAVLPEVVSDHLAMKLDFSLL